MKKINNKGVTLLEMIIYLGVFMFALVLLFNIVNSGISSNTNTNVNVQAMGNIVNTQIFLDRALQNVDNILLISHTSGTDLSSVIPDTGITVSSKYFNQHNWSINEIMTSCHFISDSDNDIVAFTSKQQLDPIIVGVIEATSESGRKYRQLATYSYRMNKDTELIRGDILAGKVTSFLDSRGRFKSEGLSSRKCDVTSGFLTPLSSRWFLDRTTTADESDVSLAKFKVLTPDLVKTSNVEDITRYGVGYVELHMVWQKQFKQQVKTLYQVFTKTFVN